MTLPPPRHRTIYNIRNTPCVSTIRIKRLRVPLIRPPKEGK